MNDSDMELIRYYQKWHQDIAPGAIFASIVINVILTPDGLIQKVQAHSRGEIDENSLE